jgi:hypothetical protein
VEELRFIDTRAHGVLDYLVGVVLIVAPWIFQFDDVAAAKWVAIGVGVTMIATALLTNYELGVANLIPMHVHLVIDAVIGAFLALSPWIFGFSDEGTNAWLPHVIVGLAEIGVAVVSSPWPRRDDLDRREREMFNRPARA